ncbi:Serine phosphatase RsbU, regulator of sigma subunit [Marivirga sericea]|uniref:Serine phosphatase RsbU, regulator of sigma subunit n=1 Tax=Marivirga sericea TaxID=1028 RepID=A0A1X7ITQ0_9BACT|nr:SpoIIE family protein phosphatase [Marivirga sericea]SMG18302.1 Serine phosphatase RsbU, regulator of sigma subunit [Marivirga sericea]
MKLQVYYITIFTFLFCANLSIFAQVQQTEQYNINDFLGERHFKSATQGDDLNIYFNTSNGILTYDGNEFISIDLENNNIPINAIQFFQNELYIASQNSLLKYSPSEDSFTKISEKEILQLKAFNNQLWLITKDELLLWEDNKLKSIYFSEKDEVFQSLEVTNSNSFIGHSQGITILEKGKKIRSFGTYLNPSKLVSSDSSIFILSENAIFNLNNGKISRDFKNESKLNDFYIDDVGKTWFIDDQNTVKFNDLTRSVPLYSEGGKKLLKGSSLFQDKENNLWVLGANSLFKITQNNPFSRLYEEGTLGVFSGQNSNLIVKKDQVINYNLVSGIRRINIPKLDQATYHYHAFQRDNDWIISLDQSIYLLTSSQDKLITLKQESNHTPLKAISKDSYLAKDSAGKLFVTNSKFEPLKKIDGVFALNKVISAGNNTIVFSKNNTIAVLDSLGEVESKLSLNDTINFKNIIPNKIGFWYFTDKSIFSVSPKGVFKKISIDLSTNLKNQHILNLYDDKEDNLWVSSTNYLLKIPLIRTDEKVSYQKPVLYNKSDFLFSTYFKSAVKDDLGLIWFINEEGISIYNPLKEIPNLVAPSVEVDDAFAYNLDNFNNPVDTVFLMENNKNIGINSIVVIEPKIINHFNTEKSSFGYRNLSTNQSERRIGIEQKIILTGLPEGLNTIQLKAYNSNGIESENEANINIYVTPPIWKRNWFYITSIISLLLIGFVGYRTVIGIKNSRAKELEDQLTKGLEDLEKKSHLQVLKAERLKQLNELITSQKTELEKKNKQIESQKYELSLTNQQIKKQKDLLEETSSKLGSSINYAKRIQNALMSTEIEIKKAFEDSFVYFLPRDVVSGDFFWFNKATNKKGEELLILAAVDCTGHGVPGAIVSVVGMNLLNNITKLKKIYDPGEILTEMNQDIISDLRQDETQVNDGMDMTIVTYNTVTKQLYFAGAKNPLMYIEDGELIRIKGDKHAIGGQQRGEERSFTTHQLDLTDDKKRTFYLFSDGYQDQFGGEKGFKYLVGNFKKLLVSIHNKNVLDQKTILHEEIEDWKDGYAQTDDILVIGFKL